MICQATIQALDAHGGAVSLVTIPYSEMAYVSAYLEEFTDRLERRGVAFASIKVDLVPEAAKPAPKPQVGGYLALFPELLGAA